MPQTLGSLCEEMLGEMPCAVIRAQLGLEHMLVADALCLPAGRAGCGAASMVCCSTRCMLDLWDRHGVKVTSHMIGEAAQRHPELAREIVARGHEAAAHGPALELAICDEPRRGKAILDRRP